MAEKPHDDFAERAVTSFQAAIEEAREIWPDIVRKEAYREWSETMRALELFDRRSRAAVLATLLPIIAIGEENDAETALRNAELLFVALLESVRPVE